VAGKEGEIMTPEDIRILSDYTANVVFGSSSTGRAIQAALTRIETLEKLLRETADACETHGLRATAAELRRGLEPVGEWPPAIARREVDSGMERGV
jgi:DNA-binding IclR family transcriptional regulator